MSATAARAYVRTGTAITLIAFLALAGVYAVTGTIADSQIAGLEKERLADHNLTTQWVNGGWRNETAWAATSRSPTRPGSPGSVAVPDTISPESRSP